MAESPPETENAKKEPAADAEAPAAPSAPAEATGETSAEPAEFVDNDSATGSSELLEKLDHLTAEANAHRDRALRAAAELENYRRRAVREKDEVRKFSNQSLLENFLPILDNFALGLDHARQHEGGKAFADGFEMVLSQIDSWLSGHGVERLDPAGAAFDPNLHEAIAEVPHAEVPEHHVIEVHRIGYRLHDRLLRPASVVVSSGPPPAPAEGGEG